MNRIDRLKYEELTSKSPDCFERADTDKNILSDLEKVHGESRDLISDQTIKYAATWLLEKDLWLESEKGILQANTEVLSRGRVVLVNPGTGNIGREQKYVHPYIVLGEYKETFIGVPITNMAKNGDRYYLRHFFEVELINPEGRKPFNEYRCSKPSVADVRNISGLDKRRIIQDELYSDKKYVPSTYLNAISEKIRSSLAII